MKTRIALLEDHVVVRRALRVLLERNKELQVVGEAGAVRDLVLLSEEYDLLICDLRLPGQNGISAISEIRRSDSKRRILVLTMYDDVYRAAEALAAGADGYAVKLDDEGLLIDAVFAVASGRRWLSPLIDAVTVDRLLEQQAGQVVAIGPLALLSLREREIFDLMVQGYSSREIGELLFISARTADTHRTHIFDKLDVHTAAELVRFAARFGLLDARRDRERRAMA